MCFSSVEPSKPHQKRNTRKSKAKLICKYAKTSVMVIEHLLFDFVVSDGYVDYHDALQEVDEKLILLLIIMGISNKADIVKMIKSC